MFVTFGGGDFRWRMRAQKLSATAQGLSNLNSRAFTDVDIFKLPNVSSRDRDFIESHPRGFGHLLWKPLLLQYLKHKHPNCSVIYLDAGCHLNLNDQSKATLHTWLNEADDLPAKLWEVEGDWSHAAYTKAETLAALGVGPVLARSRQVQAGALIVGSSSDGTDLCDAWVDAARSDDYFHLTDEILTPQSELYVAHRHDQSILSSLVLKFGLPRFPNQTYFAPNWETGSAYPFWTTRNRSLLPFNSPKSLTAMEAIARRIYSGTKRHFR